MRQPPVSSTYFGNDEVLQFATCRAIRKMPSVLKVTGTSLLKDPPSSLVAGWFKTAGVL